MGYGWVSYYWKVIRLKRMDSSTQVQWIRSELGYALKDPDLQSRRRRLLHLTDLPTHLPKSDELSKLYDQALSAYHKQSGKTRMSLVDEHAERAALGVLTQAILWARMLGFEGSSKGLSAAQSQQLADLMDAVHNIEFFLYSTDSEQALRVSLRDYDMKWDTSLAAEYERVRSGRAG